MRSRGGSHRFIGGSRQPSLRGEAGTAVPPAVLVVVAALLACTGLAAQSMPNERIGFGIAVGMFANYPQDFDSGACESKTAGVRATVMRWLTSAVALEGTATLTGSSGSIGGIACTDALAAPPTPDVPYERVVVDERIRGQTFFATNVAAAVDPLPDRHASPRLRVGAGRLWDKGLWTWTHGVGVRWRLGSHTIVADVERWNLGYDVRAETRVRRVDDSEELLASAVRRRQPRPIFLRIGWEMRVR